MKALVDQQLRTFRREFRKVDLRAARRKNLTAYDVLTIASMVEREAQVARERPVIASVIYNRLREGIPLGIDATVRFATNNWTRPLTQSQLSIDSPYNTRSRRGLPPGPIGSPGLGGHPGRRQPAPHPLPVLRGQAGHVRRARLLQDRRRVPARRGSLQPRARAPRRQVADQLLMGRTLLGVAGFPVAHSRSPAMQNAALAELGLDWLYVPVPLPPDLFVATARALPRRRLPRPQRDRAAQAGRARRGG